MSSDAATVEGVIATMNGANLSDAEWCHIVNDAFEHGGGDAILAAGRRRGCGGTFGAAPGHP